MFPQGGPVVPKALAALVFTCSHDDRACCGSDVDSRAVVTGCFVDYISGVTGNLGLVEGAAACGGWS